DDEQGGQLSPRLAVQGRQGLEQRRDSFLADEPSDVEKFVTLCRRRRSLLEEVEWEGVVEYDLTRQRLAGGHPLCDRDVRVDEVSDRTTQAELDGLDARAPDAALAGVRE